MGYAFLWGAIAGSATFLGAILVLCVKIPKKWIGLIMALGTGALIGATAYELLGEAVEWSGFKEPALGFLGGALLFTIFDYLISRNGGHERKRSNKPEEANSGLAIFIGTVMDCIPESAMIGLSIVNEGSVSLAIVIAIFISNFPEGLSSTVGLQKGGFSTKIVMLMWGSVFLISALSALGGALFLKEASDGVKALVSSFAGGGIIAMIASTMMPEAFKDGGPAVGFVTAIGVFIALALHHL